MSLISFQLLFTLYHLFIGIGAHAPTQTARHTAASSIHPSSRFRGWYVPPNCAPEELE
jgi:hypothetical protein